MATDQPQADARSGDSSRAGRLIDAFLEELDASGGGFYPHLDVKSFPSVQTILDLPAIGRSRSLSRPLPGKWASAAIRPAARGLRHLYGRALVERTSGAQATDQPAAS